jgi:four helix bundle protein
VYGLTNQMRRAAVSIPSNIAEGKEKTSDRDFAVFLWHARASLHELETQSLIAEQLGYWQGTAAATVKSLTAEIGKMLNGHLNAMRPDRAERKLLKAAG